MKRITGIILAVLIFATCCMTAAFADGESDYTLNIPADVTIGAEKSATQTISLEAGSITEEWNAVRVTVKKGAHDDEDGKHYLVSESGDTPIEFAIKADNSSVVLGEYNSESAKTILGLSPTKSGEKSLTYEIVSTPTNTGTYRDTVTFSVGTLYDDSKYGISTPFSGVATIDDIETRQVTVSL